MTFITPIPFIPRLQNQIHKPTVEQLGILLQNNEENECYSEFFTELLLFFIIFPKNLLKNVI